MNPLGQDLHFQGATGHAAQAGGQPQLVVVASATVQANDQAHIAQTGAQQVDVGHQIVRARLFTSLDQAHDARVRYVLIFQRLHGSNAGVGGVAIVGTAAPIKLAVFVFRSPGAKVIAPAIELGLLVQVAVHQHGLAAVLVCRARGCNVKKHHRGAPRQAHNFQTQARYFLRLNPLSGLAHHAVQVAIGLPVGVKGR